MMKNKIKTGPIRVVKTDTTISFSLSESAYEATKDFWSHTLYVDPTDTESIITLIDIEHDSDFDEGGRFQQSCIAVKAVVSTDKNYTTVTFPLFTVLPHMPNLDVELYETYSEFVIRKLLDYETMFSLDVAHVGLALEDTDLNTPMRIFLATHTSCKFNLFEHMKSGRFLDDEEDDEEEDDEEE